MIVSNCWLTSNSSVPQTISYALRCSVSLSVLTNCPLSPGSGSRHTHRPAPPGSRKRVFDPIPAPTSRTSPVRNGFICRDQYAFQFHAAEKRSNSEPAYLKSLMWVYTCGLIHKQRGGAKRHKAPVCLAGRHKQWKICRNGDHLNRNDSESTGCVSRQARVRHDL